MLLSGNARAAERLIRTFETVGSDEREQAWRWPAAAGSRLLRLVRARREISVVQRFRHAWLSSRRRALDLATCAVVICSKAWCREQLGAALDLLKSLVPRELRDDAGGVEELTDAGDTVLVARLSPQSRARSGEQAELWRDATRLHFFDEQSGQALTYAR